MSVVVYSSGLCACSVCAPADYSAEQVELAVNAQHPTGIENDWHVSGDDTFRGGQPNPCQCEQDSLRRHWLMEC